MEQDGSEKFRQRFHEKEFWCLCAGGFFVKSRFWGWILAVPADWRILRPVCSRWSYCYCELDDTADFHFAGNVLTVGCCRFFVENREYQAPVSKVFHGFQSGHYANTVWIMFLRDVKIRSLDVSSHYSGYYKDI